MTDSSESETLPSVTVVIVTYQSAAVIEGCLRSLPAAFAGAATADVVVVDNASNDGTADLVRSMSPEALVLAQPTNGGYSTGINAGMAKVGGANPVLVLNPDVRLEPGSVAALLRASTRPGVGIVAPRLIDVDGHTHTSLRRDPSVLRALGEAVLGGSTAGRFDALGETVTNPEAYDTAKDVHWVTGAALFVSAECAEAVGPWDESLFLYSEEVDFAQRARAAGYAVRYEPEARAVHIGGPSHTDPCLWSLVVHNKVRYFRRGHGRVSTVAFTAAVTAGEAVRAAAGRPISRAALRTLIRREDPRHDLAGGVRFDADPDGCRDGLICFSAQDWWYFNHAHSDFQLLVNAAAGGEKVLLVNSLGMRMPVPGRTTSASTRIRRKVASLAKGLRRPLPDVPTFAVFSPWFLPIYQPGPLRTCSDWCVRQQVRLAARRLGIRRPGVVVTLPTAWPAARHIGRRSLVANRSDRYSAFEEADGAWIAELERDLLAHADVAVYASNVLLAEERDLSRRAVFLDHGVDLDHFQPEGLAEHPRLAGIAHPRIGFFGAFDDYTVDRDLLVTVAEALPEAQLVLVGPTNSDLADLVALPNVHWLGACPIDDVPSYGVGFDVALMPWLSNDWIEHCNPIKLKEYLALGLPVVSTAFPEVQRYRHVISVADSAEEFIDLVRAAVAGDTTGTETSRRAAVAEDTWSRRAGELIDLIDASAVV